MGNASPKLAPASGDGDAARTALQTDLPKLIIKSRIGRGRFMKTYLCSTADLSNATSHSSVVVKAYVKQEAGEDLRRAEAQLSTIAHALAAADCPNVLPPQRAVDGRRPASTARGATGAAYLMRQHFVNSLRNRLSTRPFLSGVERKWLVCVAAATAAPTPPSSPPSPHSPGTSSCAPSSSATPPGAATATSSRRTPW